MPELLEALAHLQERLGTLANRLIEHVLVPRWNKDLVPVASSLPRDLVPSRTVFERLAEEFVSFEAKITRMVRMGFRNSYRSWANLSYSNVYQDLGKTERPVS